MLEKIDTQAYKLALPAKYGRIHPVFHVSLLEPWHSRGEDPEPQSVLIDDEEEWELDAVLDKRIRKGEPEYLIKWTDSPPYENSWEPMEYLENAKQAIRDFELVQNSHKSDLGNKRKKRESQAKKKRSRFSKKR